MATAQAQFDDLPGRHFEPRETLTTAALFADVDGDGDLDIVFGNRPGNVPGGARTRLYLNDGNGRFTEATTTHLPDDDLVSTWALASGDVDSDGDVDLVLGCQGQNLLYLNDGSGRFVDATAARLPFDTDWTTAVVLADLDRDGDLDLLTGSDGPLSPIWPTTRLYINDGGGAFTEATRTHLPMHIDDVGALAIGDVDGDGDPDLVIGNHAARNRLFLNDGTARFTDATATHMPVDFGATTDVALGDADGDGDLDIAFGNWPATAPGMNPQRLYRNDGTGRFQDVTASSLPASADHAGSVAFADVDGDRDLDLVLGMLGAANRVLLNDGAGSFVLGVDARMPDDADWTVAAALGDVDADGDVDVVFGNASPNQLCFNDGSGRFLGGSAVRWPIDRERTTRVAFGDIDGDGDLDVFLAARSDRYGNGGRDRLLLNDGDGAFREVFTIQPTPTRSPSLAAGFADVDGDGDCDLLVQQRLYANDGTGHFVEVTASQMPPDRNVGITDVAFADLDADGDVDIVFANGGDASGRQPRNRLYSNDGRGVFADVTDAQMPATVCRSAAVAVGDVDGDSDLDLVFANPERQLNVLYLNDGTGVFTDATATRLPSDFDWSNDLVLGDLDGDGDLDLVFANDGWNRLYVNDGAGRFTDASSARLAAGNELSRAVVLGDVDGDGDVDLVFGHAFGVDRLFENDGRGYFAEPSPSRMPAVHDDTTDLGLADLDGDGDLDLVTAKDFERSQRGRDRVSLNLLRQVDTPYLAAVGREYRLDVHARHGPPRIFDLVLAHVATARARIPLPPFGTFGLDPSTSIALPPQFVQPRNGTTSFRAVLPNDPNLVGTSLHAQALIVSWPGTAAHLTNVVSDRVIR